MLYTTFDINSMVTKALDKIVKRGAPVHANKVLAALKQAFSYGVRRGVSLRQSCVTMGL
jgi:hypothetical protein